MKKVFLLLFFTVFSFSVGAQVKFGYLSYDSVFQSMREYAQAKQSLADLKAKYDAEIKHSEDEFNKKYEEFLDGQKDFPPTILQKRQMELQEFMDKNVAFKEETRKFLRDAENDAYAPIQDKLNAVIRAVGKEKGFAFILNVDYNSCPYIDPSQGENISSVVKDRLK
jgi:outer membrane protein